MSEKQISYAAQDTEYLFHIKNKLSEMLERENRKDLYEKCIKVLPAEDVFIATDSFLIKKHLNLNSK